MTRFVPVATLTERGTAPIDIEAYASSDYFEAEKREVFRKSWLLAARSFELATPGDYVVKDYPFLDASILLTRDRRGVLRAFHNVCSHRAARLVDGGRGRANNFTCPYHGWGYDSTGALKIVTDAESIPWLDKSACGLTPVAVDEACDFVFINLAPEPDQSLAESFRGVDERMRAHDTSTWTDYITYGADLPVNWKCILDNFQETYHLAFTHAGSIADRSCGGENPHGHPLSYCFYGSHRGMDIWGNMNHPGTPIEAVIGRFGSIISNGVKEAKGSGQAGARHPAWSMDVVGLFPNVVIDYTPGLLSVHEMVPISVDRTRWTSTIYFAPAENAAQRVAREYTSAYNRDIVAEDAYLMQTIQSGMRSGAKRVMHYSTSEVLCRHLYDEVDKRVRPVPSPRAQVTA
jgi:phenylpropionate dioxygenase-like ring-hydroxylating dioxygenase large terminal subunit